MGAQRGLWLIKTASGLVKTDGMSRAKLAGQALLCSAACNLVRMGSIDGWWDTHHV